MRRLQWTQRGGWIRVRECKRGHRFQFRFIIARRSNRSQERTRFGCTRTLTEEGAMAIATAAIFGGGACGAHDGVDDTTKVDGM